jgi:hypothetical protein
MEMELDAVESVWTSPLASNEVGLERLQLLSWLCKRNLGGVTVPVNLYLTIDHVNCLISVDFVEIVFLRVDVLGFIDLLMKVDWALPWATTLIVGNSAFGPIGPVYSIIPC